MGLLYLTLLRIKLFVLRQNNAVVRSDAFGRVRVLSGAFLLWIIATQKTILVPVGPKTKVGG